MNYLYKISKYVLLSFILVNILQAQHFYFSPGLQIGKSTNIMTYKFGLVLRGLVLVKCMIKMEIKVLGLKRVWGYWAI